MFSLLNKVNMKAGLLLECMLKNNKTKLRWILLGNGEMNRRLYFQKFLAVWTMHASWFHCFIIVWECRGGRLQSLSCSLSSVETHYRNLKHHSDQMSEGSQVSKVALCVKILKWHSLTHQSLTHQSLTEVRYRAARAAKN